jgi:hypothetical protein
MQKKQKKVKKAKKTGAEHFGNVIKHGIAKRGCS